MSNNDSPCFETRRFEKLEERLNAAEREIATLSNELSFVRADSVRRIEELDKNTKENMDRTRNDLRDRIDGIRQEMADIKVNVRDDLSELNSNIISVNDSVQKLYITYTDTKTKVSFNERVIIGIVVLATTIGLYFIQELVKGAGG